MAKTRFHSALLGGTPSAFTKADCLDCLVTTQPQTQRPILGKPVFAEFAVCVFGLDGGAHRPLFAFTTVGSCAWTVSPLASRLSVIPVAYPLIETLVLAWVRPALLAPLAKSF